MKQYIHFSKNYVCIFFHSSDVFDIAITAYFYSIIFSFFETYIFFLDPQGYGHHWDSWFGPDGRNETAPETQLDVILEKVRNSLAAKAVKTIYPEAFPPNAGLP